MEAKTSEPIIAGRLLVNQVNDGDFFVRGVSPVMRTLERMTADMALTEIPVLLVGESGTGKETTAMHIHRLSQRRDEPFIKVRCALLTPEFFHLTLREAASGNGALGSSNSATFLFDEISELDPACQLQLLRALPDGAASPQGHCLRGHVISSTGRNLEEEVRTGRFHEELYYRINGVCLRLPPLRHRKEDIPALVDFFLKKYAAESGRQQPSLSTRSLRILLEYRWPGNVRELENTVKRIVALGDEEGALADLYGSRTESRPSEAALGRISLKEAARAAARQLERELILEALARTHWNRKRAAQELQISYKALLYKLKQIELDDSAGSPVCFTRKSP